MLSLKDLDSKLGLAWSPVPFPRDSLVRRFGSFFVELGYEVVRLARPDREVHQEFTSLADLVAELNNLGLPHVDRRM